MPGKRDENGGFTLIETLAALAICSLVVAALLSFYLNGVSAWRRGTDCMENQQSARIALERMTRDLRYARLICIEGPEKVSYRLPHDPLTYSYRRQGEELVHESRNGIVAHTKIALGITALTIQEEDGTVSITICSGGETAPFTLHSSIWPRNVCRE